MKTLQLLVLFVFVLGTSLVAQPIQGNNPEKKKGLTDEQKTKMQTIKMASYKESLPLINKLGELKAKQRTLTTVDKPELNAINANIDEIAKVQVQLAKIKVAGMMQVRAILTDEQRMFFDMHKQGKDKKDKKDFKKPDFKKEYGPRPHAEADLGVNEL